MYFCNYTLQKKRVPQTPVFFLFYYLQRTQVGNVFVVSVSVCVPVKAVTFKWADM